MVPVGSLVHQMAHPARAWPCQGDDGSPVGGGLCARRWVGPGSLAECVLAVWTGTCCDLREHLCTPHNRGLNNKCFDDCMCMEGEPKLSWGGGCPCAPRATKPLVLEAGSARNAGQDFLVEGGPRGRWQRRGWQDPSGAEDESKNSFARCLPNL